MNPSLTSPVSTGLGLCLLPSWIDLGTSLGMVKAALFLVTGVDLGSALLNAGFPGIAPPGWTRGRDVTVIAPGRR
jgi:hypothetical protein